MLRDHSSPDRDGGLQTSYQKYQAVLNALSTLTQLIKDGKWNGRKPADHDIIDLVVSKSMWFSHYRKLFSKVSQYPDMQMWLRNDDGAPADYVIWPEEKGSYKFKDLALWLEEKGKKGKGKQVKVKKGKKKDYIEEEEEEDKRKKSKKRKN
jgi:hypothetical protein